MPTYAGFGPEGILGLDGSPLVNVEISVYEDGTNTLATLYSSSTGGAQANPVSTDSYGNLVFWLAGGDYELEYNGHRVPFSTYVTGNVEHAPQHNAGESDPISGLSPSQITGTAAVLGANTFTGNQTLSNVNVVLGTTTGTKIGTATSQKLGFFNATPVIQQTGNALDALEALGLLASPTLAAADITGLGTMATEAAADYALLSGATFTGDVSFDANTQMGLRLGYGGRLYDQSNRTLLHGSGNKFDVLDETGGSYLFQAGGNGVGFIATNGLTANANAASVVPVIAKGAAAHDADFLTVENSAGTKLGGWDKYGQLNTQYLTDITGVSPYLRFQTNSLMAINQGNAANVAFAVRGMASQSGALTLWQDSASTTLASVSAAGLGTFAGLVSSTTGAFTGDVTVGAGSAAIDALLTINGGTNTGKGSAIAFKRGGSSKGYLGTRSFVIGGSTDDISLISYTDLTLGIGSQILMAMSSSANTLNAYSSTAIPLVAKGFSAQTANLQEWQNSAGTVLLSVDSGGALVGGSPVSVKLWNRTVQGTGGGSLYIGGSATGAATDGVVIDGNATTFSTGVTSGEWSSLRVGQNNNPNASSTAIHNAILVSPTINYASGGAGSYNALRIKVTETALPSGDNYLIRASAGAAGTTEKFSVKNDGVVFIANSSAPATPTGGGAIFLEGGALKFIGSSGTITTIAEA